jgi:hypothetical protein
MSSISKVLTAALYRVASTDLINKFQGKIHEAVLQAQGIANSFTIINVGSQDNVEAIVNFFASSSSMTDSDSTSRDYLGSDTDSSGKIYKWGTNESYVRTASRNPENGDTIYASDGTTDTGKTVASIIYPESGTITQNWNDGQGSIAHTIYNSILYIGGEEVTV